MELSNLRGYDPHCSWLLYESPHLFCGLPFLKSGHTFPLVAGHTTPLTQAWNNDVLSLDLLSAVIVDGFIYGFDVRDPKTRPTGNTKGIFKCVELAIGIERWSSVIPGHASVTACGDSLILLNEAGTLMIAELSSEVYREVARRSLFPGKGCWIAPAISRGYLVARCRTKQVCLFLGEPESENASGNVSSTRTIDGEHFMTSFFDRYHDRSFWSPTFHQFVAWFLACLLTMFLPATLVGAGTGGFSRFHWIFFYVAALLLGIAGTWLATPLLNQFVFTWPDTLHRAADNRLMLPIVKERQRRVSQHLFKACAPTIRLLNLTICSRVQTLLHRKWVGVSDRNRAGPSHPATGDTLHSEWSQINSPLIAFTVCFWSAAAFLTWRSGVRFD